MRLYPTQFNLFSYKEIDGRATIFLDFPTTHLPHCSAVFRPLSTHRHPPATHSYTSGRCTTRTGRSGNNSMTATCLSKKALAGKFVKILHALCGKLRRFSCRICVVFARGVRRNVQFFSVIECLGLLRIWIYYFVWGVKFFVIGFIEFWS